MSKRKILTFLVCFLTLFSFTLLIFATNNTKKSKPSSNYSIGSDLILKNNQQFKVLGDKIIFASCDESQTIVGEFDLTTCETQNLGGISNSYDNLILDQNNIYITKGDEANEQTKIFNINSNALFTIDTYTNGKDSIIISGDFIYAIDCKDRTKIKRYELNNLQNNFTYNLTYNAKGITETKNGDVLVNTQVDTYYLETNGSLLASNTVDFSQGIKALNNNFICDYNGKVYSYSISQATLQFTEIYNSMADNFDFLSSNDNNNFTLINDRIFLLDEKGTALKQFNTNESKNFLILAGNKYLANLYTQNDSVYVEIFDINNDAQDITYDCYTENNNFFKADPIGNISLEAIKNLNKWQVYFDTNVISIKDKGEPKVEIKDTNTGETFTRSLGDNNLFIDKNGWSISFDPVDSINNHNYEVKVLDLTNTNGEPASCNYDINVINSTSTDKIDSQVYNINRNLNIISNINPGTTLTDFKRNLIIPAGNLEIKSMSGNILNSGKVGTGAVLSLYQDGVLKDQLTVIIYGDLNGDSSIGFADIKLAENYLLGKEQLNDAAKIAFDINHNGNCNSLDLLLMKKSTKGLYTINQNDK